METFILLLDALFLFVAMHALRQAKRYTDDWLFPKFVALFAITSFVLSVVHLMGSLHE